MGGSGLSSGSRPELGIAALVPLVWAPLRRLAAINVNNRAGQGEDAMAP